MANVENNALANNIALFKNYVEDPNNLYGVLKAGLLTGDLNTSFVEFIGSKTMSYPVFPFDSTDIPEYSTTAGYERLNVTMERKELTVSQDRGYQMAIDYEDLINSHTTAVAYINNAVRQKEVPNIDKYRLGKLIAASGIGKKTDVNLTNDDALELYDEAAAALIDGNIPLAGTVLYCTTKFYNNMKQSPRIRRSINAMDNNGNVSSQIEMLDGVTKVVVVPADRMPLNTEYILVQPLSVIAGIKRNKTVVKPDAEDFDGILINRRLVHDCFVLSERAKGIFAGKTSA